MAPPWAAGAFATCMSVDGSLLITDWDRPASETEAGALETDADDSLAALSPVPTGAPIPKTTGLLCSVESCAAVVAVEYATGSSPVAVAEPVVSVTRAGAFSSRRDRFEAKPASVEAWLCESALSSIFFSNYN